MFQNIMFILIYLVLMCQNIKLCFSYDLSKHLGTKTAYRVVQNTNDTPVTYQGCVPIKIWMVVRHGTRLPSKKFIIDMNERLPILRDKIINNSINNGVQLDEVELESIKNWNVNINENDEKILAHEGEEEMINLAERMQSRFPNIFSTIYSNTSYKFKYTATQRTEESAKYFATGLFGRATAKSVWYPQPLTKDPVLRFYKLCEKWRKEVKKNPEALSERNLFINGTIVQNSLKKISEKLGFKRTLSFDDIYVMYMTCAFESSFMKQNLSAWCAAFNKETIQIMEYVQDLKYYWIDGYGYNLTYRQACPAIKNMIEFFQSSDENPKAVLYFTHSGTILKLLAHLGLYKDEVPLQHNNFQEHFKRKWKVSQIDAFGSNIAAVLFKCGNTKKILFLHQERPVKLPCCSELELCDFNKFLTNYKNSLFDCNFEDMCRL